MSQLDDVLEKLYAESGFIPSDRLKDPDPIPTLSPSVNWAIGGGIKPGLIHCFSGPESSGKSFFAMVCCASLLRADPNAVVIWFDAEFSFSNHWKNILIPPNDHKRLITKPTNRGFQIFDIFINKLVPLHDSGKIKIAAVVLDSLQSIISPREVKKKSTEDVTIGGLSQYLPDALKKIIEPSRTRNIPWIIISQVRQDLDPGAKYKGRTFVTTGGMAFKHGMDIEMFFEKIFAKDSKLYGSIKNMNDTVEQVGHSVRVKVYKARAARPHRVAEFKLHYDKGIVETEREIMQLGINTGVITRKGSNYYYKDQLLGNGKDEAAVNVSASPELQNALMEDVSQVQSGEAAIEDIMLAEEEDELEI